MATRELSMRLVDRTPAWTIRDVAVTAVTIPVIYSLALPFVVLDAWVMAYQAICFRLLTISRVRRRDYLAIDHHRLPYLSAVEKVNCVYCAYVNGVIGFVREVAARTQQYWCPIKHEHPVSDPHRRYEGFADYGDDAAYRRVLPAARRNLRPVSRPAGRTRLNEVRHERPQR